MGMNPNWLPLYARLWDSPMFAGCHWLRSNLKPGTFETHFATKTLDALLDYDNVMPGFAPDMLDRLAKMGETERKQDDYESVLQWSQN